MNILQIAKEVVVAGGLTWAIALCLGIVLVLIEACRRDMEDDRQTIENRSIVLGLYRRFERE